MVVGGGMSPSRGIVGVVIVGPVAVAFVDVRVVEVNASRRLVVARRHVHVGLPRHEDEGEMNGTEGNGENTAHLRIIRRSASRGHPTQTPRHFYPRASPRPTISRRGARRRRALTRAGRAASRFCDAN